MGYVQQVNATKAVSAGTDTILDVAGEVVKAGGHTHEHDFTIVHDVAPNGSFRVTFDAYVVTSTAGAGCYFYRNGSIVKTYSLATSYTTYDDTFTYTDLKKGDTFQIKLEATSYSTKMRNLKVYLSEGIMQYQDTGT